MSIQPPELQTAAFQDLCRRHQVRELSLFGSAVRGEQGVGSDLDFLVKFEPEAKVGFLALSRFSRELPLLTHCPVDLVPKASLKYAIQNEVLAEA